MSPNEQERIATALERIALALEKMVRAPKPALPMPNQIEQAHNLDWTLAPDWHGVDSEYPLCEDGEWAMNLRLLGFVPDNIVGVVEQVMRTACPDLGGLTDNQFRQWAAKSCIALHGIWVDEGILRA